MNTNPTTEINENTPQHVAIIMDGNGRWAKKRGEQRTFGHQNAIKAVKSAIEACDDLGIHYLTLYAFSSENWKRPENEVNFLMELLVNTIEKEINTLLEKGIKLNVIGETDKLPEKVKLKLEEVLKRTQNKKKATLTIALSYGAKNEILRACKKIAEKIETGEISSDQIDENLFAQHLYTKDIPEVDLMIRTSGEWRISNFMLWQIAYAELYFTDVLWPDFTKEEFFKAVEHYQKRERRFGLTGDQIKK